MAGGRFCAAFGADVDVVADFHFARGDFRFGVEAEALAIDHEAHVRAHFAVGPKIERFVDDQIADAIVALDEAAQLPWRLSRRRRLLRPARTRGKSARAARPAKARRRARGRTPGKYW